MKEYQFIRVEMRGFPLRPAEDYRDIIAEQAKQGWRLVQMITPMMRNGQGKGYWEIIMERDCFLNNAK